MKKTIALCMALSMLFVQCTVPKTTVKLLQTKPPVVREDITFSHSADQIANRDSKLKTGWARRNHVQVLQVKVVNNTNKAIHGTQLAFSSNGETLEIVDHQLAAEKLKNRKFPKYVVYIPVLLVFAIIIGALEADNRDLDGDGFTDDAGDYYYAKDRKKDKTQDYNLLQQGLYRFNIFEKTLQPGEQLNGLIAFKSKNPIETLDIQIKPVDYEVIGR